MRTKLFIILITTLLLVYTGINVSKHYKNEKRLKNISLAFNKSEDGNNIKGAIEFYNTIKANPLTGEIDPQLIEAAYRQADKLGGFRALNLNWISRGPDNYGGRTRALIIDKDNPNILVAGGVSGGVYRSTNGGKSWNRIDYAAEAGGLIISCMEQASDGTIYFGTGELYFTAMSGPNGDLTSGLRGGGMYKSTDKGLTWTYLTSTNPTANGSRWYNVQSVKADPTNPSIVYAATYSGFMKSTDAGATWNRLDFPDGASAQIFIDIAISNDGKNIFTASYGAGRCKLFRSINGGAFEKIAASVTEITNSTRLTIAIAPSDNNYVYVCSTSNGTAPYPGIHCFGGLYQSIDNGTTWTQIVAGHSSAEPFGRQGQYQGQYDNCVAVDPYNKERVFVAGVTLYCYSNKQFYKVASQEEYLDADGLYKNPQFVHVDMHNFRFDMKSKPAKMYILTDGGIYVSDDFQKDYPTYSYSNMYYTTTQYYGFAVDIHGNLLGGTQDQSSMYIDAGGLTGNSAREVRGGDGFYAEISKYDPNIMFYESQEGSCVRSNNKGKGSEAFVRDDKNNKYLIDDNFYFNTPFRLWENKEKQTFYDTSGNPYDSIVHVSKCFFAGEQGVWMTPDAVDFNADTIRWYLISKGLNGQQILSMEYTSDGDAVFVGTKSFTAGRLYRISGLKGKNLWFDQNGNFDPDYFGLKTELLGSWANRVVCGIGVSPSDNGVVVVTLGNYVSGYDHVYISKNALDDVANVTFTAIHGNLPRMPVYDAAINSSSANQDTIIIATELGMWATVNGGTTWTEENKGMGRVPTFMIRQIKRYAWWKGYEFFAATHGMGIRSTTSFISNVGIGEKEKNLTQQISVFPNPVREQLNVKYILNTPSDLQADIINLNGQIVRKTTITNNVRGENTRNINVGTLQPGMYFIRLSSDGINLVSRFNVIE